MWESPCPVAFFDFLAVYKIHTESSGDGHIMSRILIVEDDPAILGGLRDNLEFESHQVLTASDGEAGYRSLCQHSPDLVILDLMLPKLSGYDLCPPGARGGIQRAHPDAFPARSQGG